jgi:hypothetical protein
VRRKRVGLSKEKALHRAFTTIRGSEFGLGDATAHHPPRKFWTFCAEKNIRRKTSPAWNLAEEGNMLSKKLVGFAIVVLLTTLTLFVATVRADQLSGTWGMNAEKSKYSPGPAPKSLTVTIESDENNYKLDATGTDSEGKPIHIQYSAKFDGKDYPATGVTNADAVSIKRIDANTVETLQKKDGKVVMTVTTKVSADGKTRTSTWHGKNAEGKDVHNVVVFDKK